MNRRYSEMLRYASFRDRYNYLRLDSTVGAQTFGSDRYLNQKFYKSAEWLRVRDSVIVRDDGCDLGVKDRPIYGKILIHHMNPITERDILQHSDLLLNPEFLVCVSFDTHNAIHYGDASLLVGEPVERQPGDTCLWSKL